MANIKSTAAQPVKDAAQTSEPAASPSAAAGAPAEGIIATVESAASSEAAARNLGVEAEKSADEVKVKAESTDTKLIDSIQNAKVGAQGAAHGALNRLEQAWADFKNCAKTVEQHLGEDARHILDKIESL